MYDQSLSGANQKVADMSSIQPPSPPFGLFGSRLHSTLHRSLLLPSSLPQLQVTDFMIDRPTIFEREAD
ncbi:hypothetical protein L1987_72000 [Smallanthus sonchifolius]|uniref:Uncharacterized protein n=1 Tax=Smallanthus sonchifolius TaxID=185202 RepID=A0ACB9AUN2_9ASTR|nr:hypothetical protein L1987_72000 [Smallanthus sonchifolius]